MDADATGHAADAAGGALDDVADELYGLLPDEFTAGRDARAARLRAAGERGLAKEVKALRRPAVAAWLVNALVRHRADEIDRVLQLGATLRQAQAEMDAGQLRELGRQRQALVAAVGRQARGLARELGRPATDPVVEAVEETLRAALSDARAADAVRSGRLTAPLSYAGFGELDLAAAVATPRLRPLARPGAPRDVPAAPPAPPPDADRSRREHARDAVARARTARAVAEGAARRAAQHRDAARHRAATAGQRVDAARSRVEELEQVLAEAREGLERATAQWAPLRSAADDAARAADGAEADAGRARAALDRAEAELARLER